MSWNPRRFAAAATQDRLQAEPLLIWLTSDAQDRIASALDNDVLVLTDTSPPRTGMWVGLADPIPTPKGEVSMIRVLGIAEVASAIEHMCAAVRPRNPRAFDALGVPEATDFGYGLIYACSQRRENLGRASFVRDTWRNVRHLTGAEELNNDLCSTFGLGDNLVMDDSSDSLIDAARAAWTLLNDPVETEVSATEIRPETVTTGKKRTRANHEVSIIDVRRRDRSGDSDGAPVEHDHRWTVRGHWRRQPFGPGRAQRRRIWIDEHVAGPEDKPLRVRTKVQLLR